MPIWGAHGGCVSLPCRRCQLRRQGGNDGHVPEVRQCSCDGGLPEWAGAVVRCIRDRDAMPPAPPPPSPLVLQASQSLLILLPPPPSGHQARVGALRFPMLSTPRRERPGSSCSLRRSSSGIAITRIRSVWGGVGWGGVGGAHVVGGGGLLWGRGEYTCVFAHVSFPGRGSRAFAPPTHPHVWMPMETTASPHPGLCSKPWIHTPTLPIYCTPTPCRSLAAPLRLAMCSSSGTTARVMARGRAHTPMVRAAQPLSQSPRRSTAGALWRRGRNGSPRGGSGAQALITPAMRQQQQRRLPRPSKLRTG
jgi:hypothetical protein